MRSKELALGVGPHLVIRDDDRASRRSTRSFPSAVLASGPGFWMFFFIFYLYIRLHCILARILLQRVPGRLYLTCFALLLALGLACPCLDLCYPGLAPALTCPKPNCCDMPDSILVLTMH